MTTVRYSADNSEVRYNLPAAVDFTGAYTLALLLRRRSTTAFQAMIVHHNTTSGGQAKIGFETNGTGFVIDNSVTSRTATGPAADTTNWYIFAVTKGAGTVTPRFHYKRIDTGTWTHTAASGTLADSASCSGGTVRVGEFEDVDDLNANVAVDAGWNAALSDVEVEALSTNLRTSDWTGHSVVPKYVHEQTSNTAIADLMLNGATLNVVNGTTEDAASDPPGWTFTGSGVAVAPSLAMPPFQGAF